MSFKVESGIQLLSRLTRKPNIRNFYPHVFPNGSKPDEVIELFSDTSIINLQIDMICEALMPICFGGVEAGVMVFNCDGNFDFDTLRSCMEIKIHTHLNNFDNCADLDEKLKDVMNKTLRNLFIVQIYDATQLYTTIYKLESILIDHPNIALIIFDTITAFYWSEQGFKIIKMDTYTKNLLHIIQKVTKEHKVTIIYGRPEYFSSTKEIENMETCSESPSIDKINCRIQIISGKDGIYDANIMTFDKKIIRKFINKENRIEWIN